MKYRILNSLKTHGADIIRSKGMQLEKEFLQHNHTTVFAHSVRVAFVSLYITRKLHIKISERELIRGALLHDYFLYDWHDSDPSHKLHGLHHAKIALKNADRDFRLTEIEKDIIEKHMFPLNLSIPKYKESVVVCAVDKVCALIETFDGF